MTDDTGNAVKQDSVAEANFATYANPLVSEALKEVAALKIEADAEKLHKLRIAFRRLRVLLWAYRPILDEHFDNEQRAVMKFLANAAGDTRDWDILIGLVEGKSDEQLLSVLRQNRKETADRSRETLLNSDLTKLLRDAISEANRELNTSHSRTPLAKFARKRVSAAQKQLKRRMQRASQVGRSDYNAYHDVRKAGKKVRYLIEFFEPLLQRSQRRSLKELKQLQKRFGGLNDVVASRDLLTTHRESLPEEANSDAALRFLKKKQKRRLKAASKLL